METVHQKQVSGSQRRWRAGGVTRQRWERFDATNYYGAGVLTVFAFYIFRGRKWWCLLGQVLTLHWINVVLLGGLMYPIRLFGMEFDLCQQGLQFAGAGASGCIAGGRAATANRSSMPATPLTRYTCCCLCWR